MRTPADDGILAAKQDAAARLIPVEDRIRALAAVELACLVLARKNMGARNTLWTKAHELREELSFRLSENEIKQAEALSKDLHAVTYNSL